MLQNFQNKIGRKEKVNKEIHKLFSLQNGERLRNKFSFSLFIILLFFNYNISQF